MHVRVLWIVVLGLTVAAVAGCQGSKTSFSSQHPRAVLLAQGQWPPPAVQAPAGQNVYVWDDSTGGVALKTSTTQPTMIDMKDAAAFGGTMALFSVNMQHHYSIYSESIAPVTKPAATTMPAPAKKMLTTRPATGPIIIEGGDAKSFPLLPATKPAR